MCSLLCINTTDIIIFIVVQVYLFDVATLWQKVNLKAAEKMRQLHDREREIGEFYGQLNNLLLAIEDAKAFLEWRELAGYRDTVERVRVSESNYLKCISTCIS